MNARAESMTLKSATPAIRRLGYLVPEFPTQTHIFFWREIEALREMGYEVQVISTRRPPRDFCRHTFAEEGHRTTYYVYPPKVRDALQLLANPRGLSRVLKYVAGLRESSLKQKMKVLAMSLCAASLVRHAKDQKLGHIHSHSCADAAHITAMARVLGGPTFSLTLHGGLATYGVDHDAKMRLATCISTDGGHLVAPITEVGYPQARVLATCMGLDTLRFRPDEQKAKSSDEPVLIVTVARLDNGKGHRYALEAIRRLTAEGHKVRYVAAGRGNNADEIKALAGQLGLLGNVAEFPGTLAEHEVLGLLQKADVFVLSSEGIFEAYPISVMEAMSCGVPCVVSEIGATPDMVDHGTSGFLIKQGDVDALTERLREIVTNTTLRQSMSRAARARAERGFDVRQTARRLADFINQHKRADETA